MLDEAIIDETKGKTFYQDLEKKVPKNKRKIIDKIANQEGTHKQKIKALKKELCSAPKKRFIYFGGLAADTKTMEFINPDNTRRPLTKREESAVLRSIGK